MHVRRVAFGSWVNSGFGDLMVMCLFGRFRIAHFGLYCGCRFYLCGSEMVDVSMYAFVFEGER